MFNKQEIIDAGLSSREVEARVEAGKVNASGEGLTPTYAQIVRKNTLTLFNLINTVLAVALVLVGYIENTLFMGIVVANTAMGIIQEVRAKRTLDKLSILAQAHVKVIRDGDIRKIPQDKVVLDDIVCIERGDQICADGIVLVSNGLELDESLLTGESDKIRKGENDQLLSGSFVTSGKGFARITAVGDDNYANSLSQEVAQEQKSRSKLLKTIKLLIRIVTIIIIPLGGLLFYTNYVLQGETISTTVLGVAAALTGMIPGGLVILTGVTMTVGAMNLSKHKALVQSLESIETLARVDVLCLDKTGTITDGTLRVEQAELISEISEADFERTIAELMGALGDNNSTADALKARFKTSNTWGVSASVPFSSDRKWSGVTFFSEGTYLIGSPEMIFPYAEGAFVDRIQGHMEKGYRVLALAYSQEPLGGEELPANLAPEALIILSDHIRDDAKETFKYFDDEGVELKVISGDNPITASRVALKAGIPGCENYVDMSKVDESRDDLGEIAENNTVFGHVSPQQKRKLIRAMQENGHTTCMTGDGVNDILAMHESDCSVAMVTGNDATRSISDFVLMSSNFGAMVNVLREGRRVINNIERVASLYIVNSLVSIFLTLIYIFLATPFPYAPLQMTMINFFTVGVPSFFLALQRNYNKQENRFYKNIFEYALPAALTIVFNTMYLQLSAFAFDLDWNEFSTAVIFLIGIVSFFLLFRIAKPYTKVTHVMLWTMVAGFAVAFLFFQNYFMLETLFSRTALVYLPLIYFSYHINSFLGKWFSKILQFGENREDRKASKEKRKVRRKRLVRRSKR